MKRMHLHGMAKAQLMQIVRDVFKDNLRNATK